jgi:hypothetical protein
VSQTIEVESIRRLDIKPGETLVVGLPEGTRPEHVPPIRTVLEENMPDDVKLIFVSHGVSLGVISRECPSSPA